MIVARDGREGNEETGMVDLIVRGGTIVDGTGSEPFVGDVAIEGGRIVAVAPAGGSRAPRVRRSTRPARS